MPATEGEPTSLWKATLRPLRPYALPLIVATACFLLFFVARMAVLVVYRRDFCSLTAGATFAAILRGFRFDASIIFTFLAVPLACLMMPFGWAQHRWWRGTWAWICFAMLAAFALILGVDVVYFGFVHRHLGHEITFIDDAIREIGWSVLPSYLPAFLVFLAAFAGAFWLWRRMIRSTAPVPEKPLATRLAVCAVAMLLMYGAARGSLDSKRLKIVHAFESGPPAAGYLALNGPFTTLHSLSSSRGPRANFYPWTEAVGQTQELFFSAGEKAVDPAYPLLRRREANDRGKPNVVLIMLESWDAFYMDTLRREQGLAPLGATPRFDALCREGVLFTRFYATGQRSMDGMCSLLSGYPTLPNTPYLGRGMEQSALPFLGILARKEGYETFFIQSSKHNSFRCDAIAPLAGFDTYLGAEDLPPGDPAAGRAILGNASWDHEMYQEAHRRFAASGKPFAAFLYTGATHHPFHVPEERWNRRPQDSTEQRYLNCLEYSDWALGQFFDLAKKAGYFDRTIFILTADHVGGPNANAGLQDPPSIHHVPCLVIAPGLKPAVDRRIGGQLDVLPTIVELAGWGTPHAAFGRSLFDRASAGTLCVHGDTVLGIEEGGWLIHDLERRVAARKSAENADLDALERRMLSVVQVAATLLKKNLVYPSGR